MGNVYTILFTRHESTIKVDMNSVVKSKRNTRSMRLKAKKRNKYVNYPTDDEQNGEGLPNNDIEVRHDREMRRDTLNEQNNVAHNSDNIETLTKPKNLIRKSRRGKKKNLITKSRRGKKTAKAQPENLENLQVQVTAKPKSKKNKKTPDVNLVDEDLATVLAKKSKKKVKKIDHINSMIVEEVKQDVKCNPRNNTFNKSLSMGSFHSAAGSLEIIYEEELVLLGFDKDTTFDTTLGNRKTRIRDSLDKHEEAMAIYPDATLLSKSIQNESKNVTRRSMVNLRNTFVTVGDTEDSDSVTSYISNNEIPKRESNINNGTFDKLTKIIDTTFEKVAGNDKKDSTYDKSSDSGFLDTTFEEIGYGAIPKKKKSSVQVDNFDTNEEDDIVKTLQSARNRLSRQSSVKDTTYDKNEYVDDTTFEKDSISVPQKSAKKTLEKSNAKDSDNVGSSVQKVATRKSNVEDTTFERQSRRFDTPRVEEVVENQNSTLKKDSIKECVDNIKRTSLQSESKRLFDDHGSKRDLTYERNSKCSLISSDNSDPEKSYISCISITDDDSENLANTIPVLFESSMDSMEQDWGKIIKSNLKGSNKSFVFDDNVSAPSPRAAARKRSYTHNKRLAGVLQQSVDRLSRPRTSSVAAKLTKPTLPTKNPATLSKSDAKPARTQGECQEWKAKRARQLPTLNGAVNMLERISHKDTVTVPQQPKEQTKKTDTSTNLPTLKSLRPGFTRFGFKRNLDVNPFSVPSKHPETKPKPNAAKETLPSLAGATSVRREVAKQAVMREKSFTDRRNVVKRNENRTIIKGVRTNRRFELQMKMRNVEQVSTI